MPSLAVTDTHALLWAATGCLRRLGKDARRFLERVERGQAALYVPTIVLVEAGEAVRLGELRLPLGFTGWVSALFRSGRYLPVELTVPIVLRAQSLYAIPERGDRLVAATAAELECPLLTRDPEIRRTAAVETIW